MHDATMNQHWVAGRLEGKLDYGGSSLLIEQHSLHEPKLGDHRSDLP